MHTAPSPFPGDILSAFTSVGAPESLVSAVSAIHGRLSGS
ncbi:hypothetical protein Pcac1_g19825 [Phytophthora cactorum]|uniref:Uncharacterized protein n=1 Tax=Phytophthora cactorum TaxID=29920 RepID=A0A8T1DPD7_9STRA|nr:hypothetical protein Pcac1_g19825 [Phytophthora cactorum]KAG2913703.1 hypothetical protein PC114_g8493 [Phytophthora cactorum]KAG2942818.1 hypothetical protein PC117_g9633 [Phytophthora cactorum]KAG3003724.1 hypothetical protein PC120_g18989 [Phytophthora cactorum]KAG3139247.1 hypothetical protein C6341_g20438 [Phytophthora cactorum]